MELIDQFEAVDDEGHRHTVVVLGTRVEHHYLVEDPLIHYRNTQARLTDGRALTQVDVDAFKIVATGKIIRRVARR